MIEIVLCVLLAGELLMIVALNKSLRDEIVRRATEHEENVDRIVHMSSIITELSGRVDGLEDYMRMVRSESENDKHKDYWESVMEYNPFLHKGDNGK